MPSREKSLSLLSRMVERIGSPNGIGGAPAYPWEVVAGALAGLPRGHVAMVCAAYSLDAKSDKVAALELQLHIEQGIADRARGEPNIKLWRITKGSLRGLCARAVADIVYPLKCRRCQGRGHIYPRGAPVRQCDKCGGSQWRRISPRELARAVGVGAYQCGNDSSWMQRYDEIMALANDWIMESAHHLQMKLGD